MPRYILGYIYSEGRGEDFGEERFEAPNKEAALEHLEQRFKDWKEAGLRRRPCLFGEEVVDSATLKALFNKIKMFK